jgi:hypothetical protein
LCKIRDKDDNWREHIDGLEEDTLKVAVSYSVQEDETFRWKLGVAREQEPVEITVACKGIILLLPRIIIIIEACISKYQQTMAPCDSQRPIS